MLLKLRSKEGKAMTDKGRGKMLTSSGVAKLLNLHINTVRRWSDKGIMKPYRIGRRGDRVFSREDVITFLNTQQYNYRQNKTVE